MLPSLASDQGARMQNEKKPGLKERAAREMKAFLIIALYLAFVFSGFNVYKRLVLREVGISYFNYGAGLIEAFIIGKLILVGRALSFGKRFERRPLIVGTLIKAGAYGVLVAVFSVLEDLIGGLVHGKDLAGAWLDLLSQSRDETLARTVMMVVTFIPFVALLEIDRVLGEGRLVALFFHRRPAAKLAAHPV